MEAKEAGAILDAVSDGVVVLDRSWRFTYANRAAGELLRWEPGALLGRTAFEVLPGGQGSEFHRHYLDAIERGETVRFEGFSRALGRWFQVEARPSEVDLTLVLREVTEQHRQRRLEGVRRRVTQALDPAQGPLDVLQATMRSLHEVTGFDVAELWTRDHGAEGFTLDAAEHPASGAGERFVRGSRGLSLGPGSLVWEAFERGELLVFDGAGGDLTAPRAELASDAGIHRAIVLPVGVEATPDAVVCLSSRTPADHDDWLEVLREFHPELVDHVARQRALHDLERLFQLSQDSLVVARLDGYFVRVNPQLSELLGYEGHELLEQPFTSFVHPDDVEGTSRVMTEQYRGRLIESFVNRYRTADGDYRLLSWKSSPLPDEGLAYAVARDVTQEHLERTFEDAQRDVLRTLLASDDTEAILADVARALEGRIPGGRASIHLLDPRLGRLVLAAAPSLPDACRAVLGELRVGEGVGACGTAAFRRQAVIIEDATVDPLAIPFREVVEEHDLRAVWSIPFADAQGRLLGTVAVYHSRAYRPTDEEFRAATDLVHLVSLAVEQLETRRRLVESEARFRTMAEATNDAIWDWDLVSDQVWWSEGLTTLFGYLPSELPDGASWLATVHEGDRNRVSVDITRAIDGAEPAWAAEYRLRRKDGQVAFVVDRGTIVRDRRGRAIRMIGGLVDHTERRDLEQQFLRAQRMESIGSLAGGVAHDLNNVLSPIVMATDLLLHGELDEVQRETVETIGLSARRGADMVRQVLTFARGLDGERAAVDVPRLLEETGRIVRDSLLQNIEVEIEAAQDVAAVYGDATQLQQVLLNLAINAKDAMPEGGRVRVTADNLQVEVPRGELEAGRYVAIRVADTGVGIGPEVVERVFEPFFTTKQAMAGTGLGLPTSLAIVRSHQGTISVESVPGEGTTIEVLLPASGVQAPTTPERNVAVGRGAGQLVLLVDDEASVRAVTEQTLEAYGYRVLTASDGADALARFRHRADDVDVVITDVMMPVMDGIELFHRVRELRPDIPVIAVSGLTDEARLPQVGGAGVSQLLAKPLTTDSLLRALDLALESRAEEGR